VNADPVDAVHLEVAQHDCALSRVDVTDDVLPRPIWPCHLHVIVAEHLAADDVPSARLLQQLVVGALARPLPLELHAEVLNHGNELVGGRVHLPLLIFQIEEHPQPRLHDLQECVLGARLLMVQA